MAPARHPATLLLPNLPKQALVGIDFLSLTASQRFNGFTTLPPGWHFLFVGATAELSSRQGIWFYVPDLDESRIGHAGQKRQRADSQPLGVRGALVPVTSERPPEKDWLGVFEWDPETEKLECVEDEIKLDDWRRRLLESADLQKSLFPYRQSVPPERVQEVETDKSSHEEPPSDFGALTEDITAPLLDRICGRVEGPMWSLDTGSSGDADADSEHIPGLEGDERFRGVALGLSKIDLKRTWKEDAVGRERTQAARDRSWRLNEVIDQTERNQHNSTTAESLEDLEPSWGSSLLGEMQLCFIAVLTLANWSCMAQWRRILELIMTCYEIVPQRPHFFTAFLNLLAMQLTHTNLVEGGLFDVRDEGGEFLKDLLRRFSITLDELCKDNPSKEMLGVKKSMASLQETIKDIWGWELGDEWLRRGMVQLEDGEMVELETEDMEDEDERGEYAPVIVELE